jgi:amidase
MKEWKAAYDQLKEHADVKEVELMSIDEATQGGKIDIWNAFRKNPFCRKKAQACSDFLSYHKFKPLLEEYLASIDNSKIRTLQDLIDFNNQHADLELPPSTLSSTNSLHTC